MTVRMVYDVSMMQLLSNATLQRKWVGTAFGHHGNKVIGGDRILSLLSIKMSSALSCAVVYTIR